MQTWIAIACTLATAAHAGVVVPKVHEEGTSVQYRSEDGLGNYQFGYDEKHTTGGSFRKEKGDGHGRKVGSYGLHDADGRVRVVNYVADEHGFRAAVQTNEPGVAPEHPAAASVNKAPVAVEAYSAAPMHLDHVTGVNVALAAPAVAAPLGVALAAYQRHRYADPAPPASAFGLHAVPATQVHAIAAAPVVAAPVRVPAATTVIDNHNSAAAVGHVPAVAAVVAAAPLSYQVESGGDHGLTNVAAAAGHGAHYASGLAPMHFSSVLGPSVAHMLHQMPHYIGQFVAGHPGVHPFQHAVAAHALPVKADAAPAAVVTSGHLLSSGYAGYAPAPLSPAAFKSSRFDAAAQLVVSAPTASGVYQAPPMHFSEVVGPSVDYMLNKYVPQHLAGQKFFKSLHTPAVHYESAPVVTAPAASAGAPALVSSGAPAVLSKQADSLYLASVSTAPVQSVAAAGPVVVEKQPANNIVPAYPVASEPAPKIYASYASAALPAPIADPSANVVVEKTTPAAYVAVAEAAPSAASYVAAGPAPAPSYVVPKPAYGSFGSANFVDSALVKTTAAAAAATAAGYRAYSAPVSAAPVKPVVISTTGFGDDSYSATVAPSSSALKPVVAAPVVAAPVVATSSRPFVRGGYGVAYARPTATVDADVASLASGVLYPAAVSVAPALKVSGHSGYARAGANYPAYYEAPAIVNTIGSVVGQQSVAVPAYANAVVERAAAVVKTPTAVAVAPAATYTTPVARPLVAAPASVGYVYGPRNVFAAGPATPAAAAYSVSPVAFGGPLVAKDRVLSEINGDSLATAATAYGGAGYGVVGNAPAKTVPVAHLAAAPATTVASVPVVAAVPAAAIASVGHARALPVTAAVAAPAVPVTAAKVVAPTVAVNGYTHELRKPFAYTRVYQYMYGHSPSFYGYSYSHVPFGHRRRRR